MQAKNYQAGRDRMAQQEAEISALRRQLDSMQVWILPGPCICLACVSALTLPPVAGRAPKQP